MDGAHCAEEEGGSCRWSKVAANTGTSGHVSQCDLKLYRSRLQSTKVASPTFHRLGISSPWRHRDVGQSRSWQRYVLPLHVLSWCILSWFRGAMYALRARNHWSVDLGVQTQHFVSKSAVTDARALLTNSEPEGGVRSIMWCLRHRTPCETRLHYCHKA